MDGMGWKEESEQWKGKQRMQCQDHQTSDQVFNLFTNETKLNVCMYSSSQ